MIVYEVNYNLVLKKFEEVGVPLHCYYFQVHSEPECEHLLGSHQWIK